jgi:8-oxo-dGTP diphosphatase
MNPDVLHVAVGVIRNNKNQVLLSRRPANVHQANLWEFPGGKLESDETVRQALSRELNEELALIVKTAKPLIKIYHDYEEHSVLLDVWQIDSWDMGSVDCDERQGQQGQEGQKVEWVDISSLGDRDFPEANKAIIKALQLSDFYLICPEPEADSKNYIKKFKACISAGVRLFQLRFSDDSHYDRHEALITELLELCESSHSRLLINSLPDYAEKIASHGVHLSSGRLLRCCERPLDKKFLVSASCHNSTELEHACKIDVDFAVLSPVNKTSSHESVKPLGWDKFKNLIEPVNIPVYALGGIRADDMKKFREFGAQGVSVLSGIWNRDDIEKALAEYLRG